MKIPDDIPESGAEIPDLEESSDELEMSLSDLGRAYARAIGLVDDDPPVGEENAEPDSAASNDLHVCPVSPRTILEALLFVGVPESAKPLTVRQVASLMRDVSPSEVTQLVRELNAQYEQEDAAFRIIQDKNTLRMELVEACQPVCEGFYGEIRKVRLSQQAIDVLAIVAYHQPTTREHVSELRGRDCGGILSQLVRRELLSVDPDPENSRIRLYRTTDRFLRLFGLESLEDLPQSAESMLPDADL
jgi:segregation and condensation protein B